MQVKFRHRPVVPHQDDHWDHRRGHEGGGEFNKYHCEASNNLGWDAATFEIRTGQGPVAPEIHSYAYEDGILTVRLFQLAEPIVPPNDMYRMDFSGFQVHFNETHRSNETVPQPPKVHRPNAKQAKPTMSPTVPPVIPREGVSTVAVYKIPVQLPAGHHTVTLFAHNPIGWSSPQTAAERLTVSGSLKQTSFIGSSLASLAITMIWFLLISQRDN